MAHTCHATGCTTPVAPRMFMCKPHWFSLPKRLRDRIWATYRPGQEDDKNPTAEYCRVARECVRHIAAAEGIEADTELYDLYLIRRGARDDRAEGQG